MGRQWRAPGQGRSAGFTLTEVLIAVVVLSVASLGAASTVIGVVNGNNASKRVGVATMLAQAKLEELKNLSYTAADTAAGLTAGTYPANHESVTVTDGGSYTRWWTVTNVTGVGMKIVAVCVQWRGGSSKDTAPCPYDPKASPPYNRLPPHTVVVTSGRAQGDHS